MRWIYTQSNGAAYEALIVAPALLLLLVLRFVYEQDRRYGEEVHYQDGYDFVYHAALSHCYYRMLSFYSLQRSFYHTLNLIASSRLDL